MDLQQLEKDLKAIVGGRVTTSRYERGFYRHDLMDMPAWITKSLRTLPDAVVAPVEIAEVSMLLRYCADNNIPVTPRGAGTSGLHGAVPRRGGIVLDTRHLTPGVTVDSYGERVECQGAGMTWWELDRRLRRHGMTLMSYPSSARSATIAGWIMTSGLGIGNIKYGPVHDQVLSARIALAGGAVKEYSRGKDLDCFLGSEGLLGVLTEACLKVRPIPDASSHHLAHFERLGDLFEFVAGLMQTSPLPYAVEFYDFRYLRLLEAAGYPVAGSGTDGGAVLVTYDGSQSEVEHGRLNALTLLASHSGVERDGAEEEWRQRFNMLRVRRAVPSLVLGSVQIPLDRLRQFSAALGKLKKRPIGLVGHVVSRTDCVLMLMIASSEGKGLEYTFAMHTPAAISNLAISLGGKPAGGLGLWNSAYSASRALKEKAQQIMARKKLVDPKGILNPGMWPEPPLLLKPPVFRFVISTASFVDRVIPARPREVTRIDAGGDLAGCVQCGYCMGYCPTRQQWVSSTPRGRVLAARDILLPGIRAGRKPGGDAVRDVFECTLCGRCRTDCSVDMRSPEVWADLRCQLVQAGIGPETLDVLCRTIADAHNLAARPNTQRARWAENLRLDRRKETADTVYFVGCVTSFYPMVQDVARSMAQILNAAGTDFAILGGEEWCCGYPLMSAGRVDAAVSHMEHNIERVAGSGARRVVVTCPGCYRMWKHDYQRITGRKPPFEVLHSTEILARLLETSALTPGELKARVTYHDPCDLGRNAGVYDEPRYIISKIAGLELTEVEPNRQYANCCGSGGDLLASNEALSLDIARRKANELLETGASHVVTACPSCIRAITMARLSAKAPFTVLDITQLVWKAMAG